MNLRRNLEKGVCAGLQHSDLPTPAQPYTPPAIHTAESGLSGFHHLGQLLDKGPKVHDFAKQSILRGFVLRAVRISANANRYARKGRQEEHTLGSQTKSPARNRPSANPAREPRHRVRQLAVVPNSISPNFFPIAQTNRCRLETTHQVSALQGLVGEAEDIVDIDNGFGSFGFVARNVLFAHQYQQKFCNARDR